MPWEKQFCDEEVIDRAMKAFWSSGYEGTSIHDLVERTGINRGSLYAAFKNKKTLFLLALQHYQANYQRPFMEQFRTGRSPLTTVDAIFNKVVETAVTDENSCGCMLVNTATEVAPHDDCIRNAVAEGFAEMIEFFERVLDDAKASGELALDACSSTTAKALVGLLTGIQVLARTNPDRKVLEPMAQQARLLLA